MKRALVWPMAASLLGLSACGNSAGSPNSGGRPDLPTAAEVRHAALPSGASVYLNLLTDAGESVYQVSGAARSTVTSIDPTQVAQQRNRAHHPPA